MLQIGALLVGRRSFNGEDPNRGAEEEGAFSGQWHGPSVVLTHDPPPTEPPLRRHVRPHPDRRGRGLAPGGHGLESFLDRLARTPHAQDFVLKGGILRAVYGVRRPTKDVDAEAINASVTAAHIERVVQDVADVDVDDGVTQRSHRVGEHALTCLGRL